MQDDKGKHFIQAKAVLANVERGLGITGIDVPEHPEENWTVNSIPHVMMDSLAKNHGYSYAGATRLLIAISVEGFFRHPVRYCVSVAKTMVALLFEHHETTPSIGDVFPFSQNPPYWLRALLCSFVAPHAFFFVICSAGAVEKRGPGPHPMDTAGCRVLWLFISRDDTGRIFAIYGAMGAVCGPLHGVCSRWFGRVCDEKDSLPI